MDDRPFVPKAVVAFLKERYSLQAMCDGSIENADRYVGYIKGVYDVINLLDVISKDGDER